MPAKGSFRYPQALIRQAEQSLGEKLHKIAGQVMSGKISKLKGQDLGHQVLETHYQEQIILINEVVKKQDLIGITGFETEPYAALEEAKRDWTKIILDIP